VRACAVCKAAVLDLKFEYEKHRRLSVMCSILWDGCRAESRKSYSFRFVRDRLRGNVFSTRCAASMVNSFRGEIPNDPRGGPLFHAPCILAYTSSKEPSFSYNFIVSSCPRTLRTHSLGPRAFWLATYAVTGTSRGSHRHSPN